LFTPCTAVTPDRSAMQPTTISVSLTPRVAALAMAGVKRAPVVPSKICRRVSDGDLIMDVSPCDGRENSRRYCNWTG
jgi:hypothetical protein